MILGHGIDIVDLKRIENTYKKYGNKFINKFIAKQEFINSQINFEENNNKIVNFQRYSNSKKDNNKIVSFLAKHWAVKEATSKAVGCGLINGSPLHFKDIILNYNYAHMPLIEVTEKLTHIINMIHGFNYEDLDEFNENIKFHVSITDDAGINIASVILEKL